VIISDRQKISRVHPQSLPITKQSIHRPKECDKTPLTFGRTKAHKRRIMVVDDEEGIRYVLSTALSGMGYEVVTASSGTKALSLFLKRSFALILTDLEMPGMDGWNLASELRIDFPIFQLFL
jgi:PleD family two-component response regulator